MTPSRFVAKLQVISIRLIMSWKRYDGEFHQALISNFGSRPLMEADRAVFDKYFCYLIQARSHRGNTIKLGCRYGLELFAQTSAMRNCGNRRLHGLHLPTG